MEIDELRSRLEKEIRKRRVFPHYIYIAESLGCLKMKGVFSKNFSEIPSSFLDFAKIYYRIYREMPAIEFTNVKERQYVELFKDKKRVLKVPYADALDEVKLAFKVVSTFGVFKDILDAVEGFSILENISYLITDALQSEDINRMLYLLMKALTARYGFAFDRAFFFEKNENYFVGKKAMGAFNEKESNLICSQDYDEYSLEDFARRISDELPQSKLQKYVSSIKFHISSNEGKFLDVNDLKVVPIDEVPSTIKEALMIESDIVLVPVSTGYGNNMLFILDNKFTKRNFSEIIIPLLKQFRRQMELLLEDFQLKERLKELVYNDELTGVKNRRVIKKFERQKGVLVMVDLDKFKYVNDTFGHEAGDRLLKKFTSLAGEILRSQDTVLRYGGDEFLLVLKDASIEQAKRAIERLRVHLLSNSISFSAGIARLRPSIEESIRLADMAMYEAKRNGSGICIAKEEEAN